jgi:dihydrolipoamide dehydrogenase
MARTRDLVVIGGGSGGFAAAVRAAQLGGDVVVVEEAAFGGNCMHHACIPLTFLMRVSGLLDAVRGAGNLGITVDEPTVDLNLLHDRKDLIVEMLRMGTEEQLSDYGVTLVRGRGRLSDADRVTVQGQEIEARSVIIATGSVGGQLPVEGGDLRNVIDTTEAVNLREIPGRIAVVGNDPWMIELSQYFHAVGSDVSLVSEDARLLPEADREISQRLAKHLHDSGIDVRRGRGVEGIYEEAGGQLRVVLAGGNDALAVDRVVASPRFPNSAGLGLREVGVATDRGAILVDEHMRTSVGSVYAIGDVTAGPIWSHKANAEGIVAADSAMGLGAGASRPIDYDMLPRCLRTHPEVAWVGLTEDKAADRALDVRVGKVPVAINPQAMILGETSGAIKVVSEAVYGKILGIHMMGPGAIDLINAAATAMLSEATVQELMRLIPAHPSIGEALVEAAMDVEGRSLHLPSW